MFGKILALIRRVNPNYEFKSGDFLLIDNGEGPYIAEWNLTEPKPKLDDLDDVLSEEIDYQLGRQKPICCINTDKSMILKPRNGTICLVDSHLEVYLNGVWVIVS